jgi:uncharacterized protein (DUF302 family)
MPNGFVTQASNYTPAETMERLMAAIEKRGLTIFACVDHTANAVQVGLDLRPTAVLMFGNPLSGTRLMQIDQRIGIALPLKVLVWQDGSGAAMLSYEDPREIGLRFQIEAKDAAIIGDMATMLEAVAYYATRTDEPSREFQ